MSNYARRPGRILAGMLAGALALSVTPILGFTGVASAQEVADPTGAGNFCEDVPQTEPFTDVQTTDPAFQEIVCLVATEITTGVTATTYEPNSFVTRRQMALFLVRLANEANRLEIGGSIAALPAPADTDFSDTEDEQQSIEDAISQITQAEIAQGFPDNTYRPAAPVSRRQMAAFIDRTYEFLTGAPLPRSATDHFADDNADSDEAEASTNAVAEAGIFIGNPDGTFRPAQEITRRQMASVLTRTLQVLFENGEITKWAAKAGSNQAFTTSGATETRGTGLANGRQCTVTGITPGTVVDAVLLRSEDITSTNGVLSFADVGDDGLADVNALEALVGIVNVNGVNQAAPVQQVSDIVAAVGAITVTFASAGTSQDDVTLVVYADPRPTDTPAGNDRLNLNAANQPTEVFGAGCRTIFIPAEAAIGQHSGAAVTSVLRDQDTFVATDGDAGHPASESFTYDANDIFQFGGVGITMAQFEGVLSVDDVLDISYSPDAAGVSTFNIVTDDVEESGAPTATATNADGGTTLNDVRVTAVPSAQASPGQAYTVRRAATTGVGGDALACTADDPITAFTQVGTATLGTNATSGLPELQFTDSNLANGCYVYVIRATNAATGQTADSAPSNRVVIPGSVEADAPNVTSVRAADNGLVGIADATDIHRFIFDETMAATADDAGANYAVVDGDGTTANIVCGSGGTTCSLNSASVVIGGNTYAAGRVLTVTLGTVTGTGGTSASLAYPLTVTAYSSHIKDLAGNTATTTGSDNTIQVAPFTSDAA